MLAKERRTRLIRFRVSPDEYEKLSRYCATSGARSLSDLARSALQQTMRGQAGAGDPAILEQLRRTNDSLRDMGQQIAEIRSLLDAHLLEGANRNAVQPDER